MSASILFVIFFVVAIVFVYKTTKLVVTDYLISLAQKRRYKKHGLNVYNPDKIDRKQKSKSYILVY